MKVCVFGAGAIGGHIAGLLSQAGADVSAVVRGENLEAIRKDGLTVRVDGNQFNARIHASSDLRELGVQDVVFVTVKSPALPAVARAIGPLLNENTPVVFVMNGIPWWYFYGTGSDRDARRLPLIDPGDVVWNAVGPQRAIGATAMSACTLVAPGVVEVTGGNRSMVIGEPNGQLSCRIQSISALLEKAGFPVDCTTRIRDRIWQKLMINMGSGPLSLLAPVPLNELYAEPACLEARYQLLTETAAIARAMGCNVELDPEMQSAFARQSPHIPSIAQDAVAGRLPEIDAQLIAVQNLAREKGVKTPTMDLLIALVRLRLKSSGWHFGESTPSASS